LPSLAPIFSNRRVSVDIREESIAEVAEVSRYYNTLHYMLYVGDDCKVTMKHMSRNDFICGDWESSDFVLDDCGTPCRFDTKQDALKFIHENPWLMRFYSQ